jgi:serine/threonine protein phosphatase PrpC
MIEDSEIVAVTQSGPSPQAVAEELVRRANRAGGDDNISVIAGQLTEIKPKGEPTA